MMIQSVICAAAFLISIKFIGTLGTDVSTKDHNGSGSNNEKNEITKTNVMGYDWIEDSKSEESMNGTDTTTDLATDMPTNGSTTTTSEKGLITTFPITTTAVAPKNTNYSTTDMPSTVYTTYKVESKIQTSPKDTAADVPENFTPLPHTALTKAVIENNHSTVFPSPVTTTSKAESAILTSPKTTKVVVTEISTLIPTVIKVPAATLKNNEFSTLLSEDTDNIYDERTGPIQMQTIKHNVSKGVNNLYDKLDGSTKELHTEIGNLKGSVEELKKVVVSLNTISGRFLGIQSRRKRVAEKTNDALINENKSSKVDTTFSEVQSDWKGNRSDDTLGKSMNESAIDNPSMNSDEYQHDNVTKYSNGGGKLENGTSIKWDNVKSGVVIKNETGKTEQYETTELFSELSDINYLKNDATSFYTYVSAPGNKSDGNFTSAQTRNAIKNNITVSKQLVTSIDLLKLSMINMNSSINSLITSFEKIINATNSTFSSIAKRFESSKNQVSSSADQLERSTNQLTSLMAVLDPSARNLPAVFQLTTATDAVKNATEQLSLSFSWIVAAKLETLGNLSPSVLSKFNQFKNMSRDLVNVAVGMSSLFTPMLKTVEDLKRISGSGYMGSAEQTEVVEISNPKPRKAYEEEPKILTRNGTSSDHNEQERENKKRKMLIGCPRNSEDKKPPILTPKGNIVPNGNQTNRTWKSKITNFLSKDISAKIKTILGVLGFLSWGAYIFNSVK